jgi:hypothetical protein
MTEDVDEEMGVKRRYIFGHWAQRPGTGEKDNRSLPQVFASVNSN